MIAKLMAVGWLTANGPIVVPQPLEPSGKWVVSGEEGLCLLSRDYANGGEDRQLAIRPLGSEEQTEVIMVLNHGSGGVRIGKGSVRLDDGMPLMGTYVDQPLGKDGRRLITMTVDRALGGDLASTRLLNFEAGTQRAMFRVVNAAPALRILGQCEDLLLQKWGIDPVAYRAETAHAKLSSFANFGPDQYPASALSRGKQGRTVAFLGIAADGRVNECRVVSSAGDDALDHATCAAALHRLRFTPAKGPNGQPVAASFVLPVRWLLPSA